MDWTIPRWHAVAVYRSDHGAVEVPFDFEELSELEALVERGPDWNCLEHIQITLARSTTPGITVEAAERR